MRSKETVQVLGDVREHEVRVVMIKYTILLSMSPSGPHGLSPWLTAGLLWTPGRLCLAQAWQGRDGFKATGH